jgi:hypothetical protein
MTKGDFTLVVTLNPQLVYLIHSVLSVVIDYTFKRVEGDMDEWVVSGFSDRFKRRELLFLNPHPHLTTARNHFCSPLLQQKIDSCISPALLRAVRLYPPCNRPKTQAASILS